jgi:succinate dehydrogenase/fumarate reductase flavoprotein subunit
MSLSEQVVETEVLIIGAGAAGLFAAIRAKEAGVDVVVVDKAQSGFGGASPIGMQLINCAFPGDDIANFALGVIDYSGYLADQDIVYAIIGESYDRIQDLLRWGVEFMRDEKGDMRTQIADQPYSSEYKSRLVYPAPPGRPVHMLKIKAAALGLGVKFVDRVMLTDLLTSEGKVVGAVGFHTQQGGFYQFKAKAVVVATGTFSLPPKTVYYPGATGMAMAFRAGAELVNMEQGKLFKCERGHRGRGVGGSSMSTYFSDYGEWWGTRYVNAKGEEFMEKYELGQRHPGRRHWGPDWRLFIPAICREWKEGKGPCYMDLSGCANYWELLRKLYDGYCDDHVREWDYLAAVRGTLPISEVWRVPAELSIGTGGLDIGGGIRVNVDSETGVPGLYAAGIVTETCAGVAYGAASSFTACFTQGHRAGINAAKYAQNQPEPVVNEEEVRRLKRELYAPLEREAGITPDDLLANVAVIVYRSDVIKSETRLKRAIEGLRELREDAANLVAKDYHYLRKCHRAKDTLALYDINARTSLIRTESRGDHYREDYSLMDNDDWLKWLVVRLIAGTIQITAEEIPFEGKGWKHRPKPGKIDIWRLKE